MNENGTTLPHGLSKTFQSRFVKTIGSYVAEYKWREAINIDTNDDVGSVRSSNFIPLSCSVYYFEIKVLNAHLKAGSIGIGLTTDGANLRRMPGWDKHTIGYHGDDGNLFYETKQGSKYGPRFGKGDIVGCGISLATKTVFFTKNGRSLGVAVSKMENQFWYPTVGLGTRNDKIRINFGQDTFLYNVTAYYGKIFLIYNAAYLNT